MALLEKLQGSVEPKLPVHQFASSLSEWGAGETNRAAIIAFFNLDADDTLDLDWLKGKYDASVNKREFANRIHGIFMLSETGYTGYQTQAELVAIVNGIG